MQIIKCGVWKLEKFGQKTILNVGLKFLDDIKSRTAKELLKNNVLDCSNIKRKLSRLMAVVVLAVERNTLGSLQLNISARMANSIVGKSVEIYTINWLREISQKMLDLLSYA